MLQVNFIRENKEQVLAGLAKRNKDFTIEIEEIINLDDTRKRIQNKIDNSLHKVNSLSKEIGNLFKEGKKDNIEALKGFILELKVDIKVLGETLKRVEEKQKQLLYQIPNIPNVIVPSGKTANDNIEVFIYGDKPNLDKLNKPHWDIINDYNLIDFEVGNKISGAGFPIYKGKGARLQRALINFFLDEAIKAGYTEIQPPILVNEDSCYATGQLPDKESQMYHIGLDNLYLIPTAEVPITNLYRDVIVKEGELPIKMVGYTPCFRREAGNWGAHVRGLNRLHQFDKVEIVQIVSPENSYQVLDQMVEHVKMLLQKLELHFRIIRLCGGDMGFTSALTYDFEVWSGGQERWLEVSSTSNFEAFQSNRLKCRFKDSNGKMQLVHTLNGSALALPRIIASILENNQKEEGIRIPEVLIPYVGFEYITK